jgi:hypothetical protein
MLFYIKEMALLYQRLYGGSIVTKAVLDNSTELCYNGLEN